MLYGYTPALFVKEHETKTMRACCSRSKHRTEYAHRRSLSNIGPHANVRQISHHLFACFNFTHPHKRCNNICPLRCTVVTSTALLPLSYPRWRHHRFGRLSLECRVPQGSSSCAGDSSQPQHGCSEHRDHPTRGAAMRGLCGGRGRNFTKN